VSWDSKVVWSEGLFLQPHHFQQQGRHVESLVARVSGATAPFPWGLTSLEIDPELLKLGKVAIKTCAGVTPDGTPFQVPETDDQPAALVPPKTVANCLVHLAVPTRRHGAPEIVLEEGEKSAARYSPAEIEVTDSMGSDRRPVPVAVARLRLSLMLEMDDAADHLLIPVARIIEIKPDGSVVLDRAFLPTALALPAVAPLADFLREVEGMVTQRCEALAGRLSGENTAKGVAEIADFLLLMICNRALPEIRHLLAIENAHPEVVHAFCARFAGELATFMDKSRRVPDFPAYRHDDLTGTFQPVMRSLRQYLSGVLEQTAIAIPLEERKYGVRVAVISDRRLLRDASFVMMVKASMPIETVRREFSKQAKIGPVETIRQLVNSALPGIALRPLPVAPRQLPYDAGAVYFELDRASEYWQQMTTAGGLAVFVAGEFPGIEMQLWAIRDG